MGTQTGNNNVPYSTLMLLGAFAYDWSYFVGFEIGGLRGGCRDYAIAAEEGNSIILILSL